MAPGVLRGFVRQRVVGLRHFEPRLGQLELALGLIELCLVRAHIDLEQQFVRLDVAPFL